MLLGVPAVVYPPPIRTGHGFVQMAELPHGPSRSSCTPISLGKEPCVCQPSLACPDGLSCPGARVRWHHAVQSSLAHPRGIGVTAASIPASGMENLGVPAASPLLRAVQLPGWGSSHAAMSCLVFARRIWAAAPCWGTPSVCRQDAQPEKFPLLPSAGIRQLMTAEQSSSPVGHPR